MVERDSGILTALKKNPVSPAGNITFKEHPETGASVEGVAVPFWSDTKKMVLRVARNFPEVVFCGWDVCVCPDGPRIIEANPGVPHPNLVQAHAPLLQDGKIRGFFYAHNVLSQKRNEAAIRAAETK